MQTSTGTPSHARTAVAGHCDAKQEADASAHARRSTVPSHVDSSDLHPVLRQPSPNEKLATFCKRLPKVELHAHLNGSLRSSTLKELAQAKNISSNDVRLHPDHHRTLDECFALFDIIHDVTDNLVTIRRIAREAVEDAALDGVIHLELRTTPRSILGASRKAYVEAVLDGLDDFTRQHASSPGTCGVRLILSIDRREGAAAAHDTVTLAAQMQSRGVVGVDLSGNPNRGTFATWKAALSRARALGLGVTLHAAEVDNHDETREMIDFSADRLGHVCFANGKLSERLQRSGVPLEICVTSNVISKSVKNYQAHHFRHLHRVSTNPIVLCTDDSGVFDITLSHEYSIIATTFDLGQQQLIELARNGVEAAFLPASERAALRSRFLSRLTDILESS